MVKYISVLESDLTKTYWKAIQWDDTLTSIRKNRFYTAGVSLQLPRRIDDSHLETKQVAEISTHRAAKAVIIKVSSASSQSVHLASPKRTGRK